MKLHAGAVVLAGLALAAPACGSCSSSSDGGDASTGPSASQVCGEFAEAYCGRLATCAPFLMEISYGDVATCAARMALTCAPGLAAPGAHATVTDMQLCARAMESQSCDEALDNSQPSACMVPGDKPDEATCGTGTQCQSGYCRPHPGTICGKCAHHAAAGGPCLADGDCAASLVCNQGACAGPGGAGAPCSATQPCLRSLACVDAKCQAAKAVGEACTSPTECDGTHGALCDLINHRCIPNRVTTTGEPCGLVDGGLASCIRGESCANVKDGHGTCHATAQDGAPCGPDIYCMPPATCTMAARCTLPNPPACQ